MFVKTELPQQLGLHLYAVSTHLDKLVHEPPPKKILDPPMPWQQATIEIMLAISLTIACSRYIYNGVILHAHPVRGESHNQRNATGEVATLPFNVLLCCLYHPCYCITITALKAKIRCSGLSMIKRLELYDCLWLSKIIVV